MKSLKTRELQEVLNDILKKKDKEHYYSGMVEEPQPQLSSITVRLLRLADLLDRKGFIKEANDIDDILSEIENKNKVTYKMNDEWIGSWNINTLKEKLSTLEKENKSNYTCEVYGSNGVDLVFYTTGEVINCDVYVNNALTYPANVSGTQFTMKGIVDNSEVKPIEDLVETLGFNFKYFQINEMDRVLAKDKLYHVNDKGRIEEI